MSLDEGCNYASDYRHVWACVFASACTHKFAYTQMHINIMCERNTPSITESLQETYKVCTEMDIIYMCMYVCMYVCMYQQI